MIIENLNKEQLAAIMETMPFDVSFADENDVVRYWNKHETRVFKRPAATVGKQVQGCHPKQSVDKVNRLLSDLKDGKADSAEFWIDHRGKKLYIRYFAVRESSGRYLGTLEVAQDITRIKEIEGEKRILSYG